MLVIYLNLEYLDLWDLPDSRLTSSLATEVEENFYARCPPEKRPEFYGSRSSPSASPKDEETVSELITPLPLDDDTCEKKDGQEETYNPKKSWFQMKPKTFKTDSEGNRKYDSSLLKALHRTFFVRWWTGGLLVLIAGGFY
jgi:ATP-binding cassette, subfamily C (CFTR/MRP), member 1